MAACAAAAALTISMMWTGLRADSRAALTIRLYNTAAVPASDLVTARATSEKIFRDAGMAIAIRHCGRSSLPQTRLDSCSDRLGSREVVVRVINAPTFNATLPAEAFGVAYVVKATDRGWLATVFPDRVYTAASRAGIAPGNLMGFVIAHEVGHLLLGVDYHGAAGVMRPDWSDTLLSRKGESWRFSSLEALRLQQRANRF